MVGGKRCLFVPSVGGFLGRRDLVSGGRTRCRRALTVVASGAGNGEVPPDMMKGVNANITRLLSIDGGGVLGTIPARLLVVVEDEIREQLRKRYNNDPKYDWEFPVHIADYFDCLSGTSSGAILATYFASKGANVQKSIIDNDSYDQDLYKRLRNKKEMPKNAGSAESGLAVFLMTSKIIFPPRGIGIGPIRLAIPRALKQLLSPLYSADGIDAMLKAAFAGWKLTDLKQNLLVTSYNITENAAMSFYSANFDGVSRTQGKAVVNYPDGREKPPNLNVFRTAWDKTEDEGVEKDPSGRLEHMQDLVFKESDFLLTEIVRASSAAPLFFPAGTVRAIGDGADQTLKMIDGAVTSNNPTMQGLLMLAKMGLTKDPKNDLAILSLGTGRIIRSLEDKADAGLFGWGVDLSTVILSGTGWMTQALVDDFFYNVIKIEPPRYLRVQKTVFDNGENKEEVEALSGIDGSSEAELKEYLRIVESEEKDIREIREWVRTAIFDPSTV